MGKSWLDLASCEVSA